MGRGRKGVLVQSKHKGEDAYNIKQPRTEKKEQVFISGSLIEHLKKMNPEFLATLLMK